MTELQKAEFELLNNAIRVCEILNLKYFLVCGTALGSVKYNGFIPWDDDIDIALDRESYNLFINNAKNYLPKNLFVQNAETDKGYMQIYSKLRDSNTTYIEKSVAKMDMNHGIYIDVFPLDGYPKGIMTRQIFEIKKTIYSLILSSYFGAGPDTKRAIKILFKIISIFLTQKRAKRIIKRLTALISKYPTGDSQLWCNHGNWQGRLEYAPKEQYGEGTWATFEGIRVRIPERYDDYLTQKYGNWRADIPIEEKVGHHIPEIVDINLPYTEYIDKTNDGKISIKNSKLV